MKETKMNSLLTFSWCRKNAVQSESYYKTENDNFWNLISVFSYDYLSHSFE